MNGMIGLEVFLELKRRVDIYYDVQDVRIRTANRLRLNVPGEVEGSYPAKLLEIEEALRIEITQLVEQIPIYQKFLSLWRGIGPCISGGIIANVMVRFVEREPENELETKWLLKTKDKKTLVPVLRGIGAFDTVSKLWAWCGLSVKDGHALHRTKGSRASVTWSPKMRVLMWKLEQSFVKQGRYYRGVYEKQRAKYDARPDLQEGVWIDPRTGKIGKGAKGHRYHMAQRYMAKRFMCDLYLSWRKLEGLPVRPPYVLDELGHTAYEAPPIGGDRIEFKPDDKRKKKRKSHTNDEPQA